MSGGAPTAAGTSGEISAHKSSVKPKAVRTWEGDIYDLNGPAVKRLNGWGSYAKVELLLGLYAQKH